MKNKKTLVYISIALWLSSIFLPYKSYSHGFNMYGELIYTNIILIFNIIFESYGLGLLGVFISLSLLFCLLNIFTNIIYIKYIIRLLNNKNINKGLLLLCIEINILYLTFLFLSTDYQLLIQSSFAYIAMYFWLASFIVLFVYIKKFYHHTKV